MSGINVRRPQPSCNRVSTATVPLTLCFSSSAECPTRSGREEKAQVRPNEPIGLGGDTRPAPPVRRGVLPFPATPGAAHSPFVRTVLPARGRLVPAGDIPPKTQQRLIRDHERSRLALKQRGKIASHRSGIWIMGAERLLVDRQRPRKERPRRGELALPLKQGGEVVEAGRGIGMVRAERLHADRQRPLKELPSGCGAGGSSSVAIPARVREGPTVCRLAAGGGSRERTRL